MFQAPNARLQMLKGRERLRWITFGCASLVVAEMTALGQLVSRPWNGLLSGGAVLGTLILGAWTGRRS